jgi:hypothetical protein
MKVEGQSDIYHKALLLHVSLIYNQVYSQIPK